MPGTHEGQGWWLLGDAAVRYCSTQALLFACGKAAAAARRTHEARMRPAHPHLQLVATWGWGVLLPQTLWSWKGQRITKRSARAAPSFVMHRAGMGAGHMARPLACVATRTHADSRGGPGTWSKCIRCWEIGARGW